ncbi:10307_t:CDS:2 [Funneliformis geosporum]|nr:10307_t:CDS:2 [Funneliformis geosporum]
MNDIEKINRVGTINKYQGAVEIVRRLKRKGHEAYFVGGWVRDKLLGIVNEESDIDIATSCPIIEVPKIFSDAVYVGEAFGVSLIKIKAEKGYYTYDVATFRWEGIYEDGRHPKEYKVKSVSVEEDAKRRDFTINALYYDPTKDRILDFVGGKKDLENGVIRTVGSPRDRFVEDKLRMLRAVRLHFQLNRHQTKTSPTFKIEDNTKKMIEELSSELLPSVSYERI